MVGNSNYVKNDKSRKEARKETASKQKQYKGKTWERTDKRAQNEGNE